MNALWEAGVGGKLLAVLSGSLAVQLANAPWVDVDLAFKGGTILVIYLVARRLAKSKIKDGTIKDLNDALAAKDGRNKDLSNELHERTEQVRNLEQAFSHLKEQLAAAAARYEEQSKYTAQASVERFEGLLTAQTMTLGQIAATLEQVERKLNRAG